MGLLDGQVCLVSGAGQGLGRAIVARDGGRRRQRRPAGAQSPKPWNAVAGEIATAGGVAHRLCSSTSPTMIAMAEAVADVVAKFGHIDVLVNNAAINPPARTILNDTLEDWRRTIAINLESVYMGSKLVAPHMVEQKAAASSISPRSRALPRAANAAPTMPRRAASSRYTKSMAVELGPLQYSGQRRGARLHGRRRCRS